MRANSAAETASNAATEARNAVDGFGLTVGSTTTSEPGGDGVGTEMIQQIREAHIKGEEK